MESTTLKKSFLEMTERFTIEQFMAEKIVVHCKTKAEAKELIKILRLKKVYWIHSKKSNKKSRWREYKKDSCYDITFYGLGLGDVKSYLKSGYFVTPFHNFKRLLIL